MSADDSGENAVHATIGEIAFEGNFITVSAVTDTGAHLTAELRNDGVAKSSPRAGARIVMRLRSGNGP